MALSSIFRPRSEHPPGVGTGTDEELLRRFARGGDQGAFAALVRRHGPAVYGVCRRILRDDHLAEDAFQNTFLVLARKAAVINRPAALAGWLYGVALRVALKARQTAAVPVATDPTTEPNDPAARIITDELRLALDEEVARLPDADRDLLVLVYLEGKTHDEAARAVGCPLGSVAWRLGKARDGLRRQLVRRGIEMSVGAILLLAFTGRAQAVSEGLVRRAADAGRPGPATGLPKRHPVPLGCLLPLAAGIAVLAAVGWSVADSQLSASSAPPTEAQTAANEPGQVSQPLEAGCHTPP